MGQIQISLVGSFRPSASRGFSAMQHGHAAAVLAAIYWMQNECLPNAIEQDRQLRDAGHFPEHGFNVRLDVPRDIACPNCGQVNEGQSGEYPCAVCGLPTAWDDCKHEHTVIQSRGSMQFVDGAVDDNLTAILVCTDCGREWTNAAKVSEAKK